jgi:hypothetical protein
MAPWGWALCKRVWSWNFYKSDSFCVEVLENDQFESLWLYSPGVVVQPLACATWSLRLASHYFCFAEQVGELSHTRLDGRLTRDYDKKFTSMVCHKLECNLHKARHVEAFRFVRLTVCHTIHQVFWEQSSYFINWKSNYINTQTWKLKDRPEKNSYPKNISDSILKNRKIQNYS